MPNALNKFRSNRYRYLVYPLAVVAAGVLAYVGWIQEIQPEVGSRLSCADMLARSGALDEAEAQLVHVFDEEPDNLHAWLIQGLIDERRGEEERAIQSYRAALRRAEGDLARDIRLSVADLFRRIDRLEEATAELDDLEETVGENAVICKLRGLILWSRHDYDGSRAMFHRAKELNSDNDELDALLAGTLIDESRFEEARTALEKIPADTAAAWPYWQTLARSCMESGDNEGAREALGRYVQLDRYGKARLRKDAFWKERADEAWLGDLLSDS